MNDEKKKEVTNSDNKKDTNNQNNLIENIKSISINKKPRGKVKPSDHTPIEIEIS